MPYEYRIDKEEGITYSTFSGDLDVDKLIGWLTEIIGDADYEPGMSGITDLRELRWESHSEDLRKLAHFMIENRDRIGQSRSAVVVGSERVYGMTRMFEVFSEQSSLEVRAFRDIGEAKKWVLEGKKKGDKDR